MIILVMCLGMAAGWFIGAYVLDKWINEAEEESNQE